MKGKGCSAYCVVFITPKTSTTNLAPSTNYKHSAVSDHARDSGNTSTVICELERRNSCLAKQYKVAHKEADKVTCNTFLSSYWLGKAHWCHRNARVQNTSEQSQ